MPAARLGPDGVEVSRIPYNSGLINGLGREMKVPYNRSRLSIFDVQYRDENNPTYYRFRLIGAQNCFMYRFSIAEHKLIVIATDGFLTEPVEVDYIHIHTGERYDFLLRPKTEEEANGTSDFLIVTETVATPPDIAEAILHYGTIDDRPSSTEYRGINESTVRRNCTQESLCTDLNCPFEAHTPGTYIQCIPVTQMRLLFETKDEVPSNNIEDANEHFFDFGFTGISRSAAINGRTFLIPSGSLQTQPNGEMDTRVCQLGSIDCTDDPTQCICTQIIQLSGPFETTQFVLTAIGDGGVTYHPIHLHGHSFQVAGIFYGMYNSTGQLVGTNPNVTCNNDPQCTNPTWTSSRVDGEVNNKTIRKDAIVVPAGGYVVLRFIADNPGYWFMHCHIEAHLLEGMAIAVNELDSLQNPPPEQQAMLQCGSFNITVDEFNDSLNPKGSATAIVMMMMGVLQLLMTILMVMVAILL